MKIPETSANVGAYYGNEEQNGQWQSSQQYMMMSPHRMVIDVNNVGSGDHSTHRPPMYHHPGYVIPGGYYGNGPYPPAAVGGGGGGGGAGGAPVPVAPDDFADYMWMENEDEFDEQVMQQLEEEALMEQCIEAMLEDEQRERLRPICANGASSSSSISLEEAVSRSTLNPLAAEFVPTFAPSTAKAQEDKQESPPENTAIVNNDTSTDQSTTSNHTERDTQVTQVADTTPEVSAAAAGVDVDSLKAKRTDTKKNAKPKSPPVKEVKSEPKLAPKKKETSEAKQVKSESAVVQVEENNVVKVEDIASFPVLAKPPQQTAVEECSAPKPINYAAAAKANRKKPSPPPVTVPTAAVDKPASATKVQESKPTERKPAQKVEKPVQRKNSAK